jgi:hypothetical protein
MESQSPEEANPPTAILALLLGTYGLRALDRSSLI